MVRDESGEMAAARSGQDTALQDSGSAADLSAELMRLINAYQRKRPASIAFPGF
jgi:hypothetical protein